MLQLQTIPHCFRDSGWEASNSTLWQLPRQRREGRRKESRQFCTTCQLSGFSLCSLSIGQSKQHDIWLLQLMENVQSYEMPESRSRQHSVNSSNHQNNGQIHAKHGSSYCSIHAMSWEYSFQFRRIYIIKTIPQSLSSSISYFLLPKDYCKKLLFSWKCQEKDLIPKRHYFFFFFF